jgi:hypothetical protein
VTADVNELTWRAKSPRCRTTRNSLVEDAGSRDQRDDGNNDAERVDVRHHEDPRA